MAREQKTVLVILDNTSGTEDIKFSRRSARSRLEVAVGVRKQFMLTKSDWDIYKPEFDSRMGVDSELYTGCSGGYIDYLDKSGRYIGDLVLADNDLQIAYYNDTFLREFEVVGNLIVTGDDTNILVNTLLVRGDLDFNSENGMIDVNNLRVEGQFTVESLSYSSNKVRDVYVGNDLQVSNDGGIQVFCGVVQGDLNIGADCSCYLRDVIIEGATTITTGATEVREVGCTFVGAITDAGTELVHVTVAYPV